MRKVTVQPSDDLLKEIKDERRTRKIENLPDTIIAILRDYFKLPKIQPQGNPNRKKSKMQKIIINRKFRGFLVFIYIMLMLVILVNISDWQIPYLNVEYFVVNTPTDYTFIQSYPPSIDGIETTLASETINFQVHMHADTIITQNTEVNIEAEAGVGASFAQNINRTRYRFLRCELHHISTNYFSNTEW